MRPRPIDPSRAFRASAAVLLLAVVGCGGESGPPRWPVSGKVTLDGQPLTSGTITFAPPAGGAAATGEVIDGVYRIGRSGGPPAGHYQVEIVSVRPTGKRVPHPDLPSGTTDEVRNVIPPQYNVRTQLAVEVAPDRENAFDFDLLTRKVAARSPRR